MRHRRRTPLNRGIALALMLAGCASYHRVPLPTKAGLAQDLAALDHPGIAIDRPLSVAELGTLAALNDPALVAERRQHGLARAQLLQAGLLPNPSLGPAYDFNAYAPNALNAAWTVAITYDLRALIELPSQRRAARFAARQVDAQILWQEWQVIGQARLLAVDLIEGARQHDQLDAVRLLLDERHRRTVRALAAGDDTLATVIPDLTALQSAVVAEQTLDRLQQTRRQTLADLLGLSPSVELRLASTPELPPLDPTATRARLARLADFRPDLVALQLGYRSEDAKVRGAIIGQFPTFVLGLIGGRDNTRDYSVGPQPTLDLPIFNHNQGQIAIERATRDVLRDQYKAALDTADGQVRAMLDTIALQRRQRDAADGAMRATSSAAAAATRAWRNGDLDERAYTDLVTSRVSTRLQTLDLDQSILDQQVAIATLTGNGLPPLTSQPDLTR